MRKRWLAVPVLSVVVVLFAASAAWATAYSVDAEVYRTTNGECTHAHGYINNTSGLPHMDSYSRADKWDASLNYACYDYNYVGPYQIAVAQNLDYWNGSAWVTCNAGPWVENPGTAKQVNTGFSWGQPPCGHGYYAEDVGAFVWNNGWQGGWTGTTYVYA